MRGIIVWLLLSVSLHAVVIREDVSLADSSVLASSYDGVGWLEVVEGASRFRGTGVLVRDRWVLTAAHNWQSSSVTGMQFTIAGNSYTADTWVQHPGWSGSVGNSQGWDIGLIRLSSPVLGVGSAMIYGGAMELGSQITLLGAGRVGTPISGLDFNASAQLYAITNTIDRVIPLDGTEGEGGLLVFDFDDGTSGKNTLEAGGIYNTLGQSVPSSTGTQELVSELNLTNDEGSSAGGDSGGPAFADFGNGPELIGLVSWGVNPTDPRNPYGSGYGDVSYLTRVSAFETWIATTVPEPSVGIFLVLGGVILLGRRKIER